MHTLNYLSRQSLLLVSLLVPTFISYADQSSKLNLPHTPSPEMQQKPVASNDLYGRVLETMNAGGYTYVLLDTGTHKVWAAGPITKVKVGDAVRVEADMPMQHLHSKALKRDFDLVYFTDEIAVAGHVAMGGDMDPHEGIKHHTKDASLTKIKKADKGMTIAEIYRNKLQLVGKRVRVRGKVVKYTSDVLKNNWLHIEDSSMPKDLVIISQDKTRLGAVVVAEGTVSLNKDIGIGPIYEVVLEDAKLSNK